MTCHERRTCRYRSYALLLASLVGWLPGAPMPVTHAQAQPVDGELKAGDASWAKAVPLAQQRRAHALFTRGNQHVKQLLFVRAIEQYEQALALLQHPAIYFNLAIAQINHSQPAAAYENLVQALRHGPKPLGQVKYQQGQTLRKVLESQLARLDIECTLHGADIVMDGQTLFVGPGRRTQWAQAGPHRIAAEKSGYLTETKTLALTPGERRRIVLRPIRIEDATQVTRLMKPWIPWTLMAAGAAFTAGAGYLDAASSDGFARFDAEFEARCPNQGCADDEVADLPPRLVSAERQQAGAIALYAVGGVLVVGGAVLVYLNRKRVTQRVRKQPVTAGVKWQPTVSASGLGLQFRGEF